MGCASGRGECGGRGGGGGGGGEASANDGRSRVASMVLSLEMDALVGRTVEIESALRVAHSALKDAETSHYWCVVFLKFNFNCFVLFVL